MRAVRKWNGEDARHQRGVPVAVDGLGAGHGHGAEGAAVVGSLHDDDVLFPGGMPGQLDGGFDGLGSRVPEEEGVERGVRHQWEQGFDELEVRFLEGDVDLAMDQLADLGLSGFGDGGMAVAEVGDADAAGEIELEVIKSADEAGILRCTLPKA